MSPQIQIRRLINPTPAELDSTAKTVAAAWHGDYLSEALIGGNYEFMMPYRKASITAAVIGGEVYIASHGDVDFAGVAVWYGPGQSAFDSEEQRAEFDGILQKFPSELRKWWQEYFIPKYSSHLSSVFGDDTKLASWKLQMLATHPDLQGKGIGHALVMHKEAQVLPEGCSFVLETHTERNVAMYQKWGYTATPPQHYDNPLSGFQLYAMIKKPQATNQDHDEND